MADLGSASQALGHSDFSTTAAIYGHYDLSDLERAMERSPRLVRRKRKIRNGSIEPTMEAAGIEPASEVAHKT